MKLIKAFPLLFIFIANFAYAVSDDGFPSVDAAATAFLQPLMKGVSGVSTSIKSLPGEKDTKNALIKEAKKTMPENPLQAMLVETMRTNGKLMDYSKTGQNVILGGKVVKMFYTLHFLNGPKKDLMLRIMQPTMSGGYHIVDAQISNPVNLENPNK